MKYIFKMTIRNEEGSEDFGPETRVEAMTRDGQQAVRHLQHAMELLREEVSCQQELPELYDEQQ